MEFTKEQLILIGSALNHMIFNADIDKKEQQKYAELLSDIYDEIGESE